VYFATAASQNGFRIYKLSLHKKTNIFQKTLGCLIYLLSQCSHKTRSLHGTLVGVMQTPFSDAAVAKSTVLQ
jgi:hypothetical protein